MSSEHTHASKLVRGSRTPQENLQIQLFAARNNISIEDVEELLDELESDEKPLIKGFWSMTIKKNSEQAVGKYIIDSVEGELLLYNNKYYTLDEVEIHERIPDNYWSE